MRFFRLNGPQDLADVLAVLQASHVRAEADAALLGAAADDLFQAVERSPQMNRMFVVSTCTNPGWMLRPPCGGTDAIVPRSASAAPAARPRRKRPG